MSELYIFSQDDKFLSIIVKETGLVDTWFKDYQNHLIDESFVFKVKSSSPLLKYIEAENQAAFHDRDGKLRLMRMKQLYEETSQEESLIRVVCEPSYLELYDHFIEDKRFVSKTAQDALTGALQGSRYIGEVTVELGLATDNFYWIDGIEAVFKILETWGGALKDTITLNTKNEIVERKIAIVQRLGTDNGLIVEPDFNAEQINRNILSYVETALWGQGSSLEITDEEEEHTGGYTRYITFEDVVWTKSKGDPVDKPKGQKWVGDPQALNENGYLHNGIRKHRYGHFSNQDYETPEELLMATWLELQERKLKEVIHEATIYEAGKKVSLGDTVTILNRKYNKPIELQSQITGLEYDILDDKEVTIIIGKYIDMNEDPMQKDVDDLKEVVHKPRPTAPITDESFPDIVPGIPINIIAEGAFQFIQLYWDYDSKVYISHYEVYGSQVKDFIPDSQHLLWRGKVSAFAHEVATDELWYYRIRAVNTRGTASDYSVQVSASTVRIITDDILYGSITAEKLANNLDLANKLSDGTLDWINNEPLYQIQESENRILYDVGNRIGDVLNDISGMDTDIRDLRYQDTIINNRIDGISTIVQDTKFELNELTGAVDHHRTQISTFNQRADGIEQSVTSVQGDLNNAWTEMGLIDLKANSLSLSVSAVRTDFDNLEIGGRNLLLDSQNIGMHSNNSTAYPIQDVVFEGHRRLRRLLGDGRLDLSTYSPTYYDTVVGESYTISIKVKTNSDTILRVTTNGKNAVCKAGVWTTLSHTFVADSVSTRYWGIYGSHVYANGVAIWIEYKDLQAEKGNKATDWSPAPEDKADINQLISYINLSTEGIRIHGQRVHITGQTIIDDAVIGTAAIANASITNAKIGTLAVGTAQIQSLAVTNAKIGNLAVDDAKISNLSVTKLLAGEIDTSKIKIRGGSAIDYTLIDGSYFESRGRFSRTWLGRTKTHDIKFRFQNGYLRARNDSEGHSLYFMDNGISTYADGEGDGIASGSLLFRDTTYSDNNIRGVTLHSFGGVIALKSENNAIVNESRFSVSLNSDESGIYLRPMKKSRSGTNEFAFRVKDNTWEHSDGWVSFGDVTTSTYNSGLRFSKNSSSNTIYATNGNGDINSGDFSAANFRASYDFIGRNFIGSLRAPATNVYAMAAYDGELWVTDKNGYNNGNMNFRPVVAMDFRPQSSEDYKTDIAPWTDNVLSTIVNDMQMYQYVLKQQKGTLEERTRHGVITERETPADIVAGKGIDLYEYGSYAMRGLQEAGALLFVHDKEIINIEDRLDEKDLQIQYLTQEIKQLKENAA